MSKKYYAVVFLLFISICALSAAGLNIEKLDQSDKDAMLKVLGEAKNTKQESIKVYGNIKKFHKEWEDEPLAVVVVKKRILALRLRKVEIRDVRPFGGLTALEYLDLQDNKVSTYNAEGKLFGFENMVNLKVLNLSKNTVNSIKGLENCLKLESLSLNNPGKVPVYNATTGKVTSHIQASFAGIKSLSIFKNLKVLELNGNEFAGIDSAAFSALTSLEEIRLENTMIMEGLKTFAALPNLKVLDLTKTVLGGSLMLPEMMDASEKEAYKKMKARGVKVYYSM